MDDIYTQQGEPNIDCLVGAQANAVEPGKRPLSSMSPTIVLDAEGEPVLTLGAAGGHTIITQVVLGLVHTLGLAQPLDVALETPRIHHQWRPDALFVEKTMPDSVRAVLESTGSESRQLVNYGSPQAIGLDAK